MLIPIYEEREAPIIWRAHTQRHTLSFGVLGWAEESWQLCGSIFSFRVLLAREGAHRSAFWVRRLSGGMGSSTRRGGEQKVPSLPWNPLKQTFSLAGVSLTLGVFEKFAQKRFSAHLSAPNKELADPSDVNVVHMEGIFNRSFSSNRGDPFSPYR